MIRRILALVLVAVVIVTVVYVVATRPDDPIVSGVVVGKEHKRATLMTTYVSSGKIMIPIVRRLPERWIVVVEVVRESGKVATERYSVPKDKWDAIEVGGLWGVDGND